MLLIIHTKWWIITVKHPSLSIYNKIYISHEEEQYSTNDTHLYNIVIFICDIFFFTRVIKEAFLLYPQKYSIYSHLFAVENLVVKQEENAFLMPAVRVHFGHVARVNQLRAL